MKKLLAIIFVFALMLNFAGCSKKSDDEVVLYDINSASQDAATPDQSGEANASDQSQDETAENNSNPLGLVNNGVSYIPDVESLYDSAALIYYQLTSGNLPVDWDMGRFEFTVNGSTNTYWRISDSRFDSKEQLEKYLHTYFTEAFVKTFYDPKIFYDYNGHLYAIAGVSGENALYAGRSFTLTKQTTKQIEFDCISYFYKSFAEIESDKEPFKTAPADVSKYDTKVTHFVLEVSEDGYNWRFSAFGNIK